MRSIRTSVSLPLLSSHARSIWLGDTAVAVRAAGATGDTEMPLPLTLLVVPAPPPKVTLPVNVATEVGAKRTVTCWLWPMVRA